MLRRLAWALPVLWGVSFLVFLAVRILPGSPAEAMLGERATAAQVAEINAKYGWDRPIAVQYLRFLRETFLELDLGRSYFTKERVSEGIARVLPATVELAVAAMAIALILGLAAGTVFAIWDHPLSDLLFVPASLVGVSIPVFWLGLMLQLAIAPISQRIDVAVALEPVTGFYVLDSLIWGPPGSFLPVLRHLAMPAVALSTIPMAVIARMTRTSLGEALAQDYIRAARARGLSPARIALRYGLRNALIPVVTAGGLQFAMLLSGAVLTETVFSWPGLGSFIVRAAQNRDLPQLQGAVLVVAAAFIAVNLLVDLSYALLDPRVRVPGSTGASR